MGIFSAIREVLSDEAFTLNTDNNDFDDISAEIEKLCTDIQNIKSTMKSPKKVKQQEVSKTAQKLIQEIELKYKVEE